MSIMNLKDYISLLPSVCKHPCHQHNFFEFTVPLSPTKLKPLCLMTFYNVGLPEIYLNQMPKTTIWIWILGMYQLRLNNLLNLYLV